MGTRRGVTIPAGNPQASHKPGGRAPKRTDATNEELAALQREEAEFNRRRREERAASKRLTIYVKGPIYRELLRLAEQYGRAITQQIEVCIELGVRFYDAQQTPHAAPRALEMLPEILEQTVLEPEAAPVGRPPPLNGVRPPKEGAGWLGEDGGLPPGPRGWRAQPGAVVPTQEPPAEEEASSAEAAPAETAGDDDGVQLEL